MRAPLMCSMIGLVAFVVPAQADEDRDRQRYEQELAEVKAVPIPAADPGRDKATVRPLAWCGSVPKEDPKYGLSFFASALKSADKWNVELTISEATRACKWADNPVGQHGGAIIVQTWINMTGLREGPAIESLKARVNKDQFRKDELSLCDALTVSEEIAGEEAAFMEARRALFGCQAKGWADLEPVWIDPRNRGLGKDILFYIETAPDADAIVRLAVATSKSAMGFADPNEGGFDQRLINYAMDQIDYQTFAPDKVIAELDKAPYKGNSYARAVATESIGRSLMGIKAVQTLVEKKASDADWKEMLVTAPQRGLAAWTKTAQPWTAELERSRAFEKAFFGPSRKAVKGCLTTLTADLVKVMKTLKRGSAGELKDSLSDPVASLLFRSVAACASVESEAHYALSLLRLSEELRATRGPRAAAHYAALDAVIKIKEDRTKFPIDAAAFRNYSETPLYKQAWANSSNRVKGTGYNFDAQGVVKSVKKTSGGLQITFQTVKIKLPTQSCTTTNRIVTFEADGDPIYYRNCKDTGMQTFDQTPGDVTVPLDWAGGLKAGVFVEMVLTTDRTMALPMAAYKDAKKKQLVNFYGFAL